MKDHSNQSIIDINLQFCHAELDSASKIRQNPYSDVRVFFWVFIRKKNSHSFYTAKDSIVFTISICLNFLYLRHMTKKNPKLIKAWDFYNFEVSIYYASKGTTDTNDLSSPFF